MTCKIGSTNVATEHRKLLKQYVEQIEKVLAILAQLVYVLQNVGGVYFYIPIRWKNQKVSNRGGMQDENYE
ncbi:hypothetical protein CVD28_12465 [Bacillus sp. M6-12]|uniref:hypothetical protein n=1 Tax=Bacillus sp. M6-12 TaxID=2054166 RepID=UPI000C78B6A2|nr:hypothetical protein [Bacillus sp. M6-12]PLS17373.1 hypothetical protein CVD28_12465 [Bacillus sp. M6-12]